jgi:hypothetical protein
VTFAAFVEHFFRALSHELELACAKSEVSVRARGCISGSPRLKRFAAENAEVAIGA